eukprot:jgi/Hompol1/1196/HPOL_004843-RA
MFDAIQDRTLLVLIGASIVEIAIGIYKMKFAPVEQRDNLALVDGIAIIVAILIVVMVGSISDLQKQSQFRSLSEFGKSLAEVKVIRGKKTQHILSTSIVVGDVCMIQLGDVLPADGILIQGFNVETDESTLTGEPHAVAKDTLKDPFMLSGTNVINGVGRMLVIGTGVNSLNGRSLLALEVEPEDTPLQQKLGLIADLIAKFAVIAAVVMTLTLVIIYFSINNTASKSAYTMSQDILSLFILAITVVVVAVPEGLPLAVTLSLAHATLQMLKDSNLVRHLAACETMGNATTICSDKTGTLTMNRMTVVKGEIMDTPIDDKTTKHELLERMKALKTDSSATMTFEDTLAFVALSLNVNASADENADKNGKIVFSGPKTEIAILNTTTQLGFPYKPDRQSVDVILVESFNSNRKRMSTLVKMPVPITLKQSNSLLDAHSASVSISDSSWVFVKGASEIILGACTRFLDSSGTVQQISHGKRLKLESLIRQYASTSLRTICAAIKPFSSHEGLYPMASSPQLSSVKQLEDDYDLILVAVFGIMDPTRPEVPGAVHSCQKAGIVVRMVTGDNEATARAIARECGILSSDGIVMEGPEFRTLTQEEMDNVLPRLQVLARSSPLDKQVLVENLKRLGETVAVTG